MLTAATAANACQKCGLPVAPGASLCPACSASVASVSGASGARRRRVRPRRTRKRVVVTVGAVITAIVLRIIGAITAPWIFPSGFRTAAFVPSDTFLYATVTLRPGLFQLKDAASVATAFTGQPGFADALRADFATAGAPATDVQRDILPLLDGETSFAVYGDVLSPHAAFFAHSSDPARLLRLIATAEHASAPTQTYHGALVDASLGANGTDSVAGAADNGWLVLDVSSPGTGVVDLDGIIDRMADSSEASLAATTRYRGVVDRLPGGKLGFVYLDSSAPLPALVSQASGLVAPAMQRYLATFSGRAAIALSAANDAMRLSWESIPDAPSQPAIASTPGDTRAAFRRLPSDTLAAVAVPDTGALLTTLSDTITGLLSSVPGLSGDLGLRIDTMFAHWLSGALVVGIGPGTLQPDPMDGQTVGTPDVSLIAAVNDTGMAQDDLVTLDRLIPSQTVSYGGYTLQQVPTTGSGEAAYGLVDKYLYAVYGRVGHVVDARDGPGMEGNPRFQAVEGALGRHDLAFFVDLDGLRHLEERLLPAGESADYNLKVRPLITSLRALGGGIHTDADGSAHGTMVLTVDQ